MRFEHELFKRLGTLALGNTLLTLSYYVWLIGGYLNPPFMVSQWAMMLSGGGLVVYSLTSGHFKTPALFVGRRGLATALVIFGFGVYVSKIEGFSQPGFLLVESFIFIFSALVLLNALRPDFVRPRMVRAVSSAGFAALSAVLTLFSLSFSQIYVAFFLACTAAGVVLFFLKRRPNFLLPLLFVEIALFSYLLSKLMPAYATDEFAIDAYSAHLLLQGLNPYSQHALVGALSYYGLSAYYETPLSTGGYVDWLSYPSLSFLSLVPALVVGLQARVVLVALTLFFFALIYTRYRATELALIALLAALIDASVVYFPVGSVPDILWAFPLAFSLVLMEKRPGVAGALYGVSLSAKQVPAIIVPFLSYSVYKEGGVKRLVSFLGGAALSFLSLNAPFMASSPSAWIKDVFSPLTAPLVGSGQGLSEISFLGYFSLPREFFSLLEALSLVALFSLYVRDYHRYKHAYLGFPILILFFNYRFLFNYVVYWPLLALVELPLVLGEAKPSGKQKKNMDAVKHAAVALVVFVAIGGGAAGLLHFDPPLKVYSVGGFGDPLKLPGYVTSMRVNATYIKGANFRIFDNEMMTSVNGLVWKVVNVSGSGATRIYTIEPITPSLALPAGALFEVEEYDGQYHAYSAVEAAPNLPVLPIVNPSPYPYGGTIPGWSSTSDTQGGRVDGRILLES